MTNTSALMERLPLLLPKAIVWAEETSASALQHGVPLSENDVALARAVGVLHPERVRIALVASMPWPQEPELRLAGEEAGLFNPDIRGMTLGHGILLVEGRFDRRVVAHELRHVHQFERAGTIASFLPRYLQEVLTYQYWNAPLEVDARNYEHLGSD